MEKEASFDEWGQAVIKVHTRRDNKSWMYLKAHWGIDKKNLCYESLVRWASKAPKPLKWCTQGGTKVPHILTKQTYARKVLQGRLLTLTNHRKGASQGRRQGTYAPHHIEVSTKQFVLRKLNKVCSPSTPCNTFMWKFYVSYKKCMKIVRLDRGLQFSKTTFELDQAVSSTNFSWGNYPWRMNSILGLLSPWNQSSQVYKFCFTTWCFIKQWLRLHVKENTSYHRLMVSRFEYS